MKPYPEKICFKESFLHKKLSVSIMHNETCYLDSLHLPTLLEIIEGLRMEFGKVWNTNTKPAAATASHVHRTNLMERSQSLHWNDLAQLSYIFGNKTPRRRTGERYPTKYLPKKPSGYASP